MDVASLPVDTDTLKVVFTLRVLGNLSTPSVCNDMAYQEALSGVIEGYISEHGFKELALRYALNLANGRFLWRNRIGAEQIQVKVTRRHGLLTAMTSLYVNLTRDRQRSRSWRPL